MAWAVKAYLGVERRTSGAPAADDTPREISPEMYAAMLAEIKGFAASVGEAKGLAR